MGGSGTSKVQISGQKRFFRKVKRQTTIVISVSKSGLSDFSDSDYTKKTSVDDFVKFISQYQLKRISTHLFEIDQNAHRRETVTF